MATKYKSMYKYELANAAGVSSETFRHWLKSDRDFLTARFSPASYLCTRFRKKDEI